MELWWAAIDWIGSGHNAEMREDVGLPCVRPSFPAPATGYDSACIATLSMHSCALIPILPVRIVHANGSLLLISVRKVQHETKDEIAAQVYEQRRVCHPCVCGPYGPCRLRPALFAADEFQDLVNKIPRSANAVVLLNMEKAKQSPLGLKEGWRAKVEQAFEDGLVRVPPQASRFVLASQIDFEFMEPLWDAAVIELNEDLSSTDMQKMRNGILDTIEGLPAVARPNDTYIVKLAPKLVGAMGPANRQAVVRWMRDVRKPSPPPLSPYLQKAAVYSDKAGSEIIMAIDLDGVVSFERIAKYLKSKQKHLDEWGADLPKLARLLSTVQGVRIGVRIGEEPSAMIVIDLQGDASLVESYAKPLLLQILADRGASLSEFSSWTAKTEGNKISLSGKLSKAGLRRLMSVVDSPATETSEGMAQVSPGELPAMQAKASLKHFKSVEGMATDLKADMRKEEPCQHLALVRQIRQADRAVARSQRRSRAIAVQRLHRQPVAAGVVVGEDDGNPIRRSPSSGHKRLRGRKRRRLRLRRIPLRRYGAYNGGADIYGMGNVKAVGEERRVIRGRESNDGHRRSDDSTDVIAATADIRRKMSQKFQMEF